MSMQKETKYTEGIREKLENCEIPFAVYQLVDGHVRTVLVSDGLVRWQAPGSTRNTLIQYLDMDMYKNVHPEDVVFVATKAKDFAKSENSLYDVVYREKLFGKKDYRTIHATGSHYYFDGQRYAVVVYDDVSDALESTKNNRLEFDDCLVEFLNADDVEPFVIMDAKTHEIYMVSASVEKYWKPVKAYDAGITFEEYFFDPKEPQLITIEEVLEEGEVLVLNSRTGGDLVLKASLVKWQGKDAIYHRISEKTDHYFDPLTGLPNTEYCRMRGKSFADDIRAAGGIPAVVFFDISGMRLYNNANGYKKGNVFLIQFVACLKKLFPNNLIYRLTDDHFSVIADEIDLEYKLISVRRYVKNSVSKVSMDVNVGICKIEEFDPILDACEKAKIACKVQKNSSDNFIRYYDEDLSKVLLLQNYVVNHVDEAIKNGYIRVYYQPVVRTITETFCGMEALVRWIDPQYGFLSPSSFIGALEESRQIHKIDSYVIDVVCKELREEMDCGNPVVPVSFNLSRLDFTGCDIFDVVEKTLEKYQIDREYIRIEITESIMASDSYVRSEIEKFRSAGYEVWMDDFGSGYSSLNTLKDYKFDELKIDMLFLSKFNEVSRTIVISIVRMAKNLGLKTLAEGVETKEQMEFLKGIGCEKVQGYYYGKPQLLKETIKHMESIGVPIENHDTRKVYSNLGRMDFMVDTPKTIVSYENGMFKFLFANKQSEEQFQSLGVANYKDAEATCNDPKKSVYEKFREFEKHAYKAPFQTTFVNHGMYVFMDVKLLADIDGRHIYDLTFRNTQVSCVDSSSDKKKNNSEDPKTILIATVNMQNRTFLESILVPDYNILIANDGDHVFNILLEYGDKISLLLIDAALPQIDGFRIAQKLRGGKNELQIPLIVMTDNMEIAKESVRLGANHFIHTPITDKDQVRLKIDEAIKDAKLIRQLTLNYMEYVPDGVILLDALNGNIIYVNGRALDIFECENTEEFYHLSGNKFSGVILPEDYVDIDEKLELLYRSGSKAPSQTTYRIKTKNGLIKRVYHVGRFFRDTPYGNVLSVFISEDNMALREYFGRKNAFKLFMKSGEATYSKPYEPGYKSFMFWNLTKNLPILRKEGVTYIPEELIHNYTYDCHFNYMISLMSKDGVNVPKFADYTREKLMLYYANKRAVKPLNMSFNFKNGWFSIKLTFDMMADPDSGDVFLKLQNENDTDVEAYKEMTDAVVLNLFDQIIYIDGSCDRLVSLSSFEGKPVYIQRSFSGSIEKICKLFQVPLCTSEEFLKQAQKYSAKGGIFGKRILLKNGQIKYVRAKTLYGGSQKYIIVVSDVTDAE